MQNKKGLAERRGILLPCALAFNFLVYNGGRALASGLQHHNLTLALDRQLPFLPLTVLIYWGCYVFWLTNYIISAKYDKGHGLRFIGAHFIGETVCFLFFVLFPTTMDRPEIQVKNAADWLLSLTYQYDAADNLFPSIHCFASWLCFIGVRNNKAVPRLYQVFSFIIAASVCVSTLTVKQHVIADLLMGIALAEISYLLSAIPDKIIHNKARNHIIT